MFDVKVVFREWESYNLQQLNQPAARDDMVESSRYKQCTLNTLFFWWRVSLRVFSFWSRVNFSLRSFVSTRHSLNSLCLFLLSSLLFSNAICLFLSSSILCDAFNILSEGLHQLKAESQIVHIHKHTHVTTLNPRNYSFAITTLILTFPTLTLKPWLIVNLASSNLQKVGWTNLVLLYNIVWNNFGHYAFDSL